MKRPEGVWREKCLTCGMVSYHRIPSSYGWYDEYVVTCRKCRDASREKTRQKDSATGEK